MFFVTGIDIILYKLKKDIYIILILYTIRGKKKTKGEKNYTKNYTDGHEILCDRFSVFTVSFNIYIYIILI